MKAFGVGLLVIAAVAVLCVMGFFLLPFFIVLGFFLKILLGILFLLFSIWLIGKLTLWMIESMRDK